MKPLKVSFILLLILLSFSACKKDKVGVDPLPGVWAGMVGDGNNSPNTPISFEIKSDGTLDVLNVSNDTGTKTWSLNGTTFTADVHYESDLPITTHYTATYDSGARKLNGTWSNDYGSGTWYMDKQ